MLTAFFLNLHLLIKICQIPFQNGPIDLSATNRSAFENAHAFIVRDIMPGCKLKTIPTPSPIMTKTSLMDHYCPWFFSKLLPCPCCCVQTSVAQTASFLNNLTTTKIKRPPRSEDCCVISFLEQFLRYSNCTVPYSHCMHTYTILSLGDWDCTVPVMNSNCIGHDKACGFHYCYCRN